ncbi:MAG: DUF433 domain-containing protein [Planctomycetes bacterium]|nr:DUF433 domain-containing protein [Planctomycetota bacterium]
MAGTKLDFHLEEEILKDLLFLARNAEKIEAVIKAAEEVPPGNSTEKTVQYVANKTGLNEREVDRLLSTVHNILRTQLRMRIDVSQFLEAATREIEDRASETSSDQDLTIWKGATETLRAVLEAPQHFWLNSNRADRHVPLSDEEWFAERSKHALLLLRECVEWNPGKHEGVLVLRGTRFPISQIFAEMSEGLSINDIAADFELDLGMLRALLEGLSIHLDRPLVQ